MEQTACVMQTLKRLEFSINEQKLVTEPDQAVLYLGYWWDLKKWIVYLLKERHDKLKESVRRLRAKAVAYNRDVAQFLGLVQNVAISVQLAREKYRQTQWEQIVNCA